MNRYPLWKYLLILAVLSWAVLYTLPNFYGEAPAVQVSSAKATVKVGLDTKQEIESILKSASLTPDLVKLDGNSIKARFDTVAEQAKANEVLKQALNPDSNDEGYTVSLNLTPRTPNWLMALHAMPMYLGLDLRGGIHLMMQVDTQAALLQKTEARSGEIRRFLREKDLRVSGIEVAGNTLTTKFSDADKARAAQTALTTQFPDQTFVLQGTAENSQLQADFKPEAVLKIQENALQQNISTLHNRVNELGVSEPVIQQQGLDRIVVQLAGVQDMARVQQIIGRIATLQTRMVDESLEGRAASMGEGNIPLGSERYYDGDKRPVIVKKDVIFSGDNLTDAWVDQDNNGRADGNH